MIKVYSAPKEIAKPSFDLVINGNVNDYTKACDEYESEIVSYCKKHSRNKHAGSVVRFGVADGYASYVVFTPGKLIHIDSGDAYNFPYIERLTAKDITDKITQDAGITKLFGS